MIIILAEHREFVTGTVSYITYTFILMKLALCNPYLRKGTYGVLALHTFSLHATIVCNLGDQ